LVAYADHLSFFALLLNCAIVLYLNVAEGLVLPNILDRFGLTEGRRKLHGLKQWLYNTKWLQQITSV